MKFSILSFLLFFPFAIFSQSNALDFDGSNDKVTVTNASSLITSGSGLSMTFWVYPSNTSPSYPDFDGFVGFRNNSTADFYILQLSTSNVEARFRGSGGTNYDVVGTNLSVNTWQHYALTYNGSSLVLYRNGSQVGTTSASGSITSTNESFALGNLIWNTTNFYFDGKLDDVSLWNKALSASEVSCIYEYGIDTSSTGLQLYYSHDQGKAGQGNTGINTLDDAMGNINGGLSGFSLSGSSSNWVQGVNVHTYVNADACEGDSVLFNGTYYFNEGRYNSYHPVGQGCDSIAQLILDIHEADTVEMNHRICMGDSVEFNHIYLKDEGNYSITLTNQYGCDSTSIKNIDVDTVDVTVNQGGQVLYSTAQNALYQWYNCDGDSIIPGETNQTFGFTDHASYAVIVTQNNCTDTSDCHYTAMSVDEYSTEHWNIYPNPTKDLLFVNGLSQDYTISMYDLSGKQCFREDAYHGQKIDISSIEEGLYMVVLSNDESSKTFKLVVQRSN